MRSETTDLSSEIEQPTTQEIAERELAMAEEMEEAGYDDAQFWVADAKERLRLAKLNQEQEVIDEKEFRDWERLLKRRPRK